MHLYTHILLLYCPYTHFTLVLPTYRYSHVNVDTACAYIRVYTHTPDAFINAFPSFGFRISQLDSLDSSMLIPVKAMLPSLGEINTSRTESMYVCACTLDLQIKRQFAQIFRCAIKTAVLPQCRPRRPIPMCWYMYIQHALHAQEGPGPMPNA